MHQLSHARIAAVGDKCAEKLEGKVSLAGRELIVRRIYGRRQDFAFPDRVQQRVLFT